MSENEDNIRRQLVAAFGHDDIYQILNVPKTATASEIKKGYMKLALIHHPDKGGDKEKFQALSMAHSILSDEEKRRLYDANGTLDDFSEFNEESFDFWYQYFRNLFPKISLDDISRFENEYIGSEEEKRDVVAAYEANKGHLKRIMDTVMFAEEGHEARIIELIDAAIEEGLLSSTKAYERERKKALDELQDEQKQNKKKRKHAEKAAASEEALAALIQARQKNAAHQQSVFANIISKYSEDGDDTKKGRKSHKKARNDYEIDDSEFARVQQQLQQDNNNNSSNSSRKKQSKSASSKQGK